MLIGSYWRATGGYDCPVMTVPLFRVGPVEGAFRRDIDSTLGSPGSVAELSALR